MLLLLVLLLELGPGLVVRPRNVAGDAPRAAAEVLVERGDEVAVTSGRRAVNARRTSDITPLCIEVMMTCSTAVVRLKPTPVLPLTP